MRRPALLAALAALLAIAACAPKPKLAIGAAPKGAYRLDKAHASVIWRVSHGGGLSHYVARFDRVEAALDLDTLDPTRSRVEATIDPTSVSTGRTDFDQAIAAGADLLDAKRAPEIRFTSTTIERTGENSARVTGDLSFRGVVKPVALETTFNGSAFDVIRQAQVAGFSARAVFKRSDWGATGYLNFGVGDEVEVLIEAEFIKK